MASGDPAMIHIRREDAPIQTEIDSVTLDELEEDRRIAIDRRAGHNLLTILDPLDHALARGRVDDAPQHRPHARPHLWSVLLQLDPTELVAAEESRQPRRRRHSVAGE